MTDTEAIDGFLSYLQGARGRQPRTLEAYRAALLRLCEFMDGTPLLQASPLELETFTGIWLHKRGVIARSRKPYVSAVRGFFAWARRRGQLRTDPAEELRQPKTGRTIPDALSLANAERLMWAPDLATFLGLRDAAILGLLIGCGLRVSGVVSLNVSDVRNAGVEGQTRLVIKVTEKGERQRLVPVPREAEMLLRIYLDHEELQGVDRALEDGDQVLFINARNTRVPLHEYRGEAVRLSRQAVWRMIQRYGRAQGIPEAELHPHAIRHLFGTELSEDAVDLILRQELMGHADPKSTAIYDSMAMRRKVRSLDAAGPLAKIKSPASALLAKL
jgi:site-specific recombinase XerD